MRLQLNIELYRYAYAGILISFLLWRRKQFENGAHDERGSANLWRKSMGCAMSGVQGQNPWAVKLNLYQYAPFRVSVIIVLFIFLNGPFFSGHGLVSRNALESLNCHRKLRLSPNSATVAVVSPFSATVALFCDSVDRALVCNHPT